MGYSNRVESRLFFLAIMWRVGLLIASTFGFVWLVETLEVEILFTVITGVMVIGLQAVLLTRYVMQLGRLMEEFIGSIGLESTPEIQFSTKRILFKGLKERSNSIKRGMNAGRLDRVRYNQILVHAIDSADMGLLCSRGNGELLFVNEAAGRLISDRNIKDLDGIRGTNEKLWKILHALKPDNPEVVRLTMGQDQTGREQLFSIRMKEVEIFQETYRLFSIQNIQEELHKNESDSWQKIIRVLTHEIMNAVAPMLSLTKSMQKKLPGTLDVEQGKVMEGLKVIERTGEGLISFTEEYRRLSLLPPPKKEKLIVEQELSAILLLVEEEIRKNKIGISINGVEPGGEISADRRQFEMIMLNLLKNSFDALKDRDQDRSVKISIKKSASRTLLMVEDNGSGIDETLTDQVFVPFFSTKEDGSGIGLSLVRQIMNKHDGFIYLESVPGKSTVVTLVFPD